MKLINDPIVTDQARAIREHSEAHPAPRQETPREGRYRVQREQAERDAKSKPHTGY